MTATTTHPLTHHRPALVNATLAVLVFLGVTAIAGSIGLIFTLGNAAPSTEWLDRIPLVDSWFVPGLVLGLGFGVGSLVTAYGMRSRSHWPWLSAVERWTGHHWSWVATLLLGIGHAAWITFEFVYLPLSALEFVYGAVAVTLIVMPLLRPVREYLAVRP